MQQQTKVTTVQPLGAGLVTFSNLFNLPPGASPNCLNVKFGVDNTVEKRLGSDTTNAVVIVSSAATGFSPDSAGTLSTALKAYWKLDETGGDRIDAFDNHTLTAFQAPLFGAGLRGNAASFVAGNSQALIVAYHDDFDAFARNFWVSTWVYLSTTDAGYSPSALVTLWDDQSTSAQQWSLQYSLSADRFAFMVQTSAGTLANRTVFATNVSSPTVVNQWNLINAWVDSAAGTMSIRVGTFAALTSAMTLQLNNTGVVNYTSFGCAAISNPGRPAPWSSFMAGSMDEVSIRLAVPTSQNIVDLYNSGNASTYNAGAANAGFGMFDFGAGLVSGQQLRWLVVAAGTGIVASSNRGVTTVTIGTGRGAHYQEFTGSRSFLIATSETQNKVLYWSGSVGTVMQVLAPGSAPPAKHALDFAGFLLLMNHSGGLRQIVYADNTLIETSPYTNTFTVQGELDDEITGGVAFQRSAYVYTKHMVSRVSHVGGNPDFSTQLMKQFGAVPRTIQKASYMDVGEVIISFGYDRHVRIFDGSEDRIISTPIEQWNGMSEAYLENVNISQFQKFHAVVDTNEQTYRLWVVMQPSTEVTHCFCLNLRTGAWYPYLNPNVNAATMAESSNSVQFMAVKRDGFIHILNSGNTDSGTAIADFYQGPLFFGETPRTVTKSQKMALYFFPTSSGSVYYSDRTNLNTAFRTPRESIALTDTSTMIQVQKILDVPRTQNVYQFQLTSSAATAAPWKLTRVDFEHQDMGIGGG